ncbi:MAG: hypothetical protein BWY07_02435 [Candidatus Hydrogenedentes bacterium ADurb.Bin170]|nr:MAG: hypothetical protein BWY07_02435 [Candidatus Hydrogenedentes bacterium ADurb.Bin170]
MVSARCPVLIQGCPDSCSEGWSIAKMDIFCNLKSRPNAGGGLYVLVFGLARSGGVQYGNRKRIFPTCYIPVLF